jgi:hypothetical protein
MTRADIIKIAYERLYKSLQLAGYGVHGKVAGECWFEPSYKIEAIAAEYWSTITKAIQRHEHTNLPVDFTKPQQNKVKMDKVKVLEVLLDN